jgi:predicted metal-dependent hydrolase
MVGYDRLYVEFLYYFNIERDYFECHEVMEELWLEEGRKPLFQGLLQIAVGLYHHRNGNVGGAIKLFAQGIDKLQSFPKFTLGIDLAAIVEESRDYVQKLLKIEQTPFEFYDLNIIIVDPELGDQVQAMIADGCKHQDDETV